MEEGDRSQKSQESSGGFELNESLPEAGSVGKAQPSAAPPEWTRKLEEKQRLHDLLLERIKQRSGDLENMWKEMNAHWTYEDPFYRFYHGSYKVCGVQQTTARAVELLRRLMPDRPLDATFEEIIRQGTGKKFAIEHNKDWDNHTRPMLEAFTHAKFMIEMCLRYRDLPKAPTTLPSGWAALLYLYGLR